MLTYAGHLESLESVSKSDRYQFEKVDICDAKAINQLFNEFQPDAIMHLAAESHVDRSIENPMRSTEVNIWGTVNVLHATKENG